MARTLLLKNVSHAYRVEVESDIISVDGLAVPVTQTAPSSFRVGDPLALTAWAVIMGETRWVYLDGQAYVFEVERRNPRRRAVAGHAELTAPMPATVLRVDVAAGDSVKRGDTLILLEAMKMELPVRAPDDGRVSAVHCAPGDLVQPGAVLIDLEE
jgi:biotin carboxyl carrier protein